MPRTKFRKKVKNGNTYFFYRLNHPSLIRPRDLYGKTVTELQDKIDKLTYDLDRGIHSDKCVFVEYMALWMEAVLLIDKKHATIQKYNGLFNKYIKESPIANIQLNKLNSLTLQDWYKKLVKNGVSSPLLHSINNLICQCVHYAYCQNKIVTDFSKQIMLPKVQKKKMDGTRRKSRALSIEQEDALLKVCKGTKWEAFILTAINTGMRRGELMALTWDDVDFERGIITVNKSYRQPSGTTSPKTKSSNREIPMPLPVANILRNEKRKQLELAEKLPDRFVWENLVFTNDKGAHIAATSLGRALSEFSEKIGMEDSINVHDFRDTYATRLYERTKDLKMIQALLGHSDFSTTADIYTHVSIEEKKKVVNSVF